MGGIYALLLICVVSAIYFRKQMSHVILFPPLFLVTYFILSFRVLEIAHHIPIFDFDYHVEGGYSSALYILLVYPLGLLAGFVIPAKKSGISLLVEEAHSKKENVFSSVRRTKHVVPKDLILSFIGTFPALIIFIGADIEELISRNYYPLQTISKFWMGLADTFFWIAIIAIVLINRSWLKLTSLAIIVLAFAAAGARQAIVGLIIYVVLDRYLMGRRRYSQFVLLVLTLWILFALISMRLDWVGGIKPFLIGLFQFSDGLKDLMILSINYMTIFSIVSIDYSVNLFGVNADGFVYAINPLPSSMSGGFAEFEAEMSARPNVPYPALAMIYNNIGILGLFLIGLSTGFLGFCALRYSRAMGVASISMLMFFFLVPYLFGMQYNLRAFSRLFYFSAFLLIFYQFFVVRFSFKFLR